MQSHTTFGRSRLALFLYKIVAELIPATRAAPLASSTQSNSPTTATSAASAPSADDSRDGTFQVLADGTQDLAALVGVFATDSVEQYAIDYNKGHISSAVATLSLLGILGYIRALVKLAMGAESCHNAGLNVNALRPLFGIPDADRLPLNEVHEVHYMQRHELDQTIFWKESRIMKHTMDSMGVLSRIQNDYPLDQEFNMARFYGKGRGRYFRSPLPDFAVLLLSAMCVGSTSFLLIPLRKPTQTPTWSLLFATVGLFLPIFATSLTWAWVFAQEQLPPDESNFLETLNDVAYTRSKGSYFLLAHLRIIETTSRKSIQAMSLIAALIAIVGYVCQYIEVRRMSARNSGIWLAAQGVLALIRMAIWIKDPAFDNHKLESVRRWHDDAKNSKRDWITKNWSPNFSDMQLGFIWNERIRKDKSFEWQCICELNGGRLDQDFSMPAWAAKALENSYSRLHKLFCVAMSIHSGLQNKEPDTLSILHKKLPFWDMPGRLFMSWIWSHARPEESPPSSGTRFCNFSCRLVQDEDGECHVLPFWIMGGRCLAAVYRVQMFGNLKYDAATLIHMSWKPFRGNNNTLTSENDMITDEAPITGWDNPVPLNKYLKYGMSSMNRESLDFIDLLSDLSGNGLSPDEAKKVWIRHNVIYTMDLMWKDLIALLVHSTRNFEQTPAAASHLIRRMKADTAYQLIRNRELSPPKGRGG